MRTLPRRLATTLFLLAAARGALARERVTEIVGEPKGDSWAAGYAYAQGGCKVTKRNGQIPVGVAGGRRALKIEVTGTGGGWGVGIARKGWVRWYLDDYVPGGVMEFRVAGASGGEGFRIGVADSDTDGDGPDGDFAGAVDVTRYVTITRAWQTVRIPITDMTAAEPKLRLDDCIKVVITGGYPAKPTTFFIRELCFKTTSPERKPPPVKVSQLGYRPGMRKVAKVSARLDAFRVVDARTGGAAFTGRARQVARNDPVSGDDVWEADFSGLRRPGRYRLEAEGLEPSAAFEIRDDIYDRLFADSVRFYYLQRCGVALDEKRAGKWRREACHLGDRRAVMKDGRGPGPGGSAVDVTGGWHDAGDCNKYPPWVRYPVFMMLDLFDIKPEAFTDGELNIPDSGNGVPDLLDEVSWELDWLLRMQVGSGPKAGAVYDRIHQNAAPRGGKHARLQEERRLLPPTSEAAAVCAAVWARAHRTLSGLPLYRDRAERYLAAARKAYSRLEADRAEAKHILTAAACLYDATGEDKYLDAVRRHFEGLVGNPRNPAQVDRFMWSQWDCSVGRLALSGREGEGVREKARAFLTAFADMAVDTWRKDAYSVPLWNPDHYCWSSNLHICKMGYFALLTNTFAPREEYVRMAEDCLHYALGRNAVGMSMVTGYGERATDIYHSIYGGSSHAWRPPPPGVMPGGVNQWNSRGISAWPSKHYRSDPNNWTLTEPAIYYNAPLVFLSGYFAKMSE